MSLLDVLASLPQFRSLRLAQDFIDELNGRGWLISLNRMPRDTEWLPEACTGAKRGAMMLEFVRMAAEEAAASGPRTLAEMHAEHVSRRRREDGRAPAPMPAPPPPLSPPRLTGPRMAALLKATEEEFGFSPLDLVSHRRQAPLVIARQAAMYVAVTTTLWSLPQTGRYFGRDHTTVLHAKRKIAAMVAADPEFAARVARIAARIPLTPWAGLEREAAEA